jgi:hypothetical protein
LARALFHCDDFNEAKIDAHHLSKREIAHAWAPDLRTDEYEHMRHGTYRETLGVFPSGRVITIVWRWNVREGIEGVYVITAY